MPVYSFRCSMCGTQGDSVRQIGDVVPPTCPTCNTPMHRVYTPFGFRRSMPEHFNHAAGTYVSNERQLQEHYRIKSAEDTERLGMEVKYAPIDPSDLPTVANKTDAGLEDQERRHRALGWTERKQLWL